MSLLGDVGSLFGIGGTGPDKSSPITLAFKSAQGAGILGGVASGLAKLAPSPPAIADGIDSLLSTGKTIKLFTSYSFERNLLAPGAPFRFTAPGVQKDIRLSIRSGDTVQLLATNKQGQQIPVATGFIDETDTHITASTLEYVLTGRDTIGQLIDNAAVDKENKVIYVKDISLATIAQTLVNNTRMPQKVVMQQAPNATLLFQTNPGETKINALQRYLEFTNCLIWTLPNGQMVVGKPDVLQEKSGTLAAGTSGAPALSVPTIGPSPPQSTNVLDVRIRRNTNTAVRQIVAQLQNLQNVDAGAYTIQNQDDDVQKISDSMGGRSVYEVFSYGEGANAVNFLTAVGNFSGAPDKLGAAFAERILARENVKVLECEVTVQGHFNSEGDLYDVDQVYYCNFPDDDVQEDMYVYGVTHELTVEHGMTTKLRMCRAEGTLVAGTFSMPLLSIPISLPKVKL